MILNGELSMGHARVLSKMEDESKITGLAKKLSTRVLVSMKLKK